MEKIITMPGQEKLVQEEKPQRPNMCGNCGFSDFERDTSDAGACHFNPPQVVAVPQQNPLTKQMMIGIQSFYPPVSRISWCGHHVPAIITY